MNILVTGGAGFIGSHVAERYCAMGYIVHIVDDLSTGLEQNIPEDAQFHNCSYDDPEAFSILKQHNIKVLCHHAAQIDVRKSVQNPIDDIKRDIAGSAELFRKAVESGVEYVIFASSGGAIYGEQEYYPADENHPINPDSTYGLHKWMIEKYLDYYSRKSAMKYCLLRYANVYGPRQNHCSEAGVVAIFANKMLRNEQCVINGTGEQTRDFVYVDDVVAANVRVLQQHYHGVLNIGTEIETTINEVFDLLTALLDCEQLRQHGPTKDGEQFRSVLSSRKARKIIHWSPEVTLQSGMQKTAEYFTNVTDMIGTS